MALLTLALFGGKMPKMQPGGSCVQENRQSLIEKIEALPAEQVIEVEKFVDFIRRRQEQAADARAAAEASAAAFACVWNNPEDDVYDAL